VYANATFLAVSISADTFRDVVILGRIFIHALETYKVRMCCFRVQVIIRQLLQIFRKPWAGTVEELFHLVHEEVIAKVASEVCTGIIVYYERESELFDNLLAEDCDCSG
jgi:hypothetical protein